MNSIIPKSHPRYKSLMIREQMKEALHKGLIHETGLIAHGRGEAFDYLLGEKTPPITEESVQAAAEALLTAKHPVFSLNGNVVSLVAKDCVRLSQLFPIILEVNLFHQSKKRVALLIEELKKVGATDVLGLHPTMHIPHLDHNRGWCEEKGIFSADVVLVPLEDGDRCKALKDMGKFVITIDLNPFSRTAKTADITIVDNITRALPSLIKKIDEIQKTHQSPSLHSSWDNKQHLKIVYGFLSKRINDTE